MSQNNRVMNREVKFRVWNKTNKEMIYLADNPASHINLSLNNAHWGLFEGDKRICGDADDSGELMQYTGMQDSNGRRIYEGDIVLLGSSSTQYIVKFGQFDNELAYEDHVSGNGWYIEDVNNYIIPLEGCMHLTVDGNVFQNLVLLNYLIKE